MSESMRPVDSHLAENGRRKDTKIYLLSANKKNLKTFLKYLYNMVSFLGSFDIRKYLKYVYFSQKIHYVVEIFKNSF